jgi:hypothetical protein
MGCEARGEGGREWACVCGQGRRGGREGGGAKQHSRYCIKCSDGGRSAGDDGVCLAGAAGHIHSEGSAGDGG